VNAPSAVRHSIGNGPTGPTRAPVTGPSGPNEDRVRLSLRILAHLARVGPLGSDEVASPESTQQGIARALSVTQGAVSKILGPLVAAEVIRRERRHVRGKDRRVKVYFLTVRGDELAKKVQEKFHFAPIWPARIPEASQAKPAALSGIEKF
jgi:DNA-binding MarR family transcriptional regulator